MEWKKSEPGEVPVSLATADERRESIDRRREFVMLLNTSGMSATEISREIWSGIDPETEMPWMLSLEIPSETQNALYELVRSDLKRMWGQVPDMSTLRAGEARKIYLTRLATIYADAMRIVRKNRAKDSTSALRTAMMAAEKIAKLQGVGEIAAEVPEKEEWELGVSETGVATTTRVEEN